MPRGPLIGPRRPTTLDLVKMNTPTNSTLKRRINKLAELVGKPEVKHHSNYLTAIDVTDKGNGTNQIFLANAIVQGDTDINRDGDKARMLSLSIRANLIYGDTTNVVRMVVFQWYSGSNSIPLENVTEASDASGRQWMSPYKHDHAGKFKILYDKTYSLSNSSHQQYTIRKTIRFKGKNSYVTFNNGSTTINENAVYVAFVSDSAGIPHPTLNYYYRLRFSDV